MQAELSQILGTSPLVLLAMVRHSLRKMRNQALYRNSGKCTKHIHSGCVVANFVVLTCYTTARALQILVRFDIGTGRGLADFPSIDNPESSYYHEFPSDIPYFQNLQVRPWLSQNICSFSFFRLSYVPSQVQHNPNNHLKHQNADICNPENRRVALSNNRS